MTDKFKNALTVLWFASWWSFCLWGALQFPSLTNFLWLIGLVATTAFSASCLMATAAIPFLFFDVVFEPFWTKEHYWGFWLFFPWVYDRRIAFGMSSRFPWSVRRQAFERLPGMYVGEGQHGEHAVGRGGIWFCTRLRWTQEHQNSWQAEYDRKMKQVRAELGIREE